MTKIISSGNYLANRVSFDLPRTETSARETNLRAETKLQNLTQIVPQKMSSGTLLCFCISMAVLSKVIMQPKLFLVYFYISFLILLIY